MEGIENNQQAPTVAESVINPGGSVQQTTPPAEIVSGGTVGDSKNLINAEAIEKVKQDILDLREDFRREKANILIIFGIFASFITFLTIEIKIFSSVTNPLTIIGVSLFFLGALSLFILLLSEVSRMYIEKSNSNTFAIKLSNPVFIATMVSIILGVVCIILAQYLSPSPRNESINQGTYQIELQLGNITK